MKKKSVDKPIIRQTENEIDYIAEIDEKTNKELHKNGVKI